MPQGRATYSPDKKYNGQKFGKALNFLVTSKSHLITDIEDLLKQGIVFNACENTMKKYGINKQMLIPAVVSVPSGVAELILKQEEGWSYLKAGL